MTTNLYNSSANLIAEINLADVSPATANAYLTGKLRNDEMTEWAQPSTLADGRRCEVIYLFSANEMAAEENGSECLKWTNAHIDRVVLDSDEDDAL